MPKLTKRGKIYYARLGRGPGGFVSLATSDRTAAELALRRIQRERADPAHAAAHAATVDSCLRAHLVDRKMRGRAEGTLHMIRVKSGHLLRLLGKDTSLAQIDARAVDAMIAKRLTEGAARNTIQKELSVLRGALRHAKRKGEYPLDLLAVLPQGFSPSYTPRVRTLTEEQATKLLANMQFDRAAHVAWILATGGRWSESLAAQRGDAQGAAVLVRGTKTDGALRTAVVPEYCAPLLARALADASGRAPRLFAPWASVRRDLDAACDRAKIPTVTPNDLRRTHATWLRARGVDAALVAAQLGHGDSRMVERVYGRLSPMERAQRVSATLAGVRRVSAHVRTPEEITQILDEVRALLEGENMQESAANQVPRDGIEPPTRGFSIPSKADKTPAKSTIWLRRVRDLSAQVNAWRALGRRLLAAGGAS